MKSVEEEANEIVEAYILRRGTNAVLQVEKERHGKGCGCRNCTLAAVRELNSWVDFLIGDEYQADLYKAQVYVKKNGRLVIMTGFDFLKK